MPSLWRSLRLKVEHRDWQQRAFCHDFYLRRSRGRQLSNVITMTGQLRSLLQPYDQISSLSLGFFSDAGPLVMADFRGIEELVVYTDGSDPALAVAHFVAQLPLGMRSLKFMKLWLNVKLLSNFNSLAWAGLTNPDIVIGGRDSFPCLLHLCPNLSSLTMIGIFTMIETLERFAHAKLQTLRISGHLQLDWIGNLNAITLPSLHAVEVRNVGQWLHEEFKAFLTRSQSLLESLVFGGGVLTTDQQWAEYVTFLLPSN